MQLLDGGMGHLLRRSGVRVAGRIGSMERFLNVALANHNQPQLVRNAHMEYLRAGAEVITTNNYSCVPAALKLSGSGGPAQLEALIKSAGQLACEARDTFAIRSDKPKGLVAGCLPPLHESYRPDRVAPDAELEESYAQIVESIAPWSDLLLCETMSSVREGKAAAEAAARSASGLPIWIAWTLAEEDTGVLRSGEAVEEAVLAVAGVPRVEAMLFNCCSHDSILAALPRLQLAAPPGVRLGVYANGFRTVKGDGSTGGAEYQEHLTPQVYAEQAGRWLEGGASIVGGCCGIFPEHIAAVAAGARAQVWPSRAMAEACRGCS